MKSNNLRYSIRESSKNIELVDEDNMLKLNHPFTFNDMEWLSVLKDFLNKQDIILRDVIYQYGECVDEINDFRARIIYILQEEISDCEQEINLFNKKDPFIQGRLLELHNLMKILL